MARFKHEWHQIEIEFINYLVGKITLKDIAEKYNIPYQSVRRYAAVHKWHSKRYRLGIEKQHGMKYEDYLRKLYREALHKGLTATRPKKS